jgi:hypothetical protein
MTADGQCWELPTLEHRTSGTGSGCVPNGETFWRTPTAHEWKNTGHATQIHLSDQVRPSQVKNPKKAAAMWPTPVATDHLWNNSERLESWQARADKKKAQGVNLQFALRHAVQKWPTPTARDWKSGKASDATMERNSRPLSEQIGGSLNPTWVEWLMGWPLGWTDLKPSETDKSHCAQPQRGNY